jgi:pSer/pThr/pTyr-binding forkhead associated (FHA) protein
VRVQDPEVSREHCSIKLRDGVPVLTDLGSANGTLLNGRAVDEHVLADGDEIRIGSTVLRFQVV